MESVKEIKKNLEEIYSLKVSGVKLIVDQQKKRVWEIYSSQGKKVLKKIPVNESRAGLIVELTRYLIRQGMKVPPIITSCTDKDYYLSTKGEIFLLIDWIEGSQPEPEYHLEHMVKTLAQFHKCTRTFNINSYIHVPDRRGNWLKAYRKRQKKLLEVKICSMENNEVTQIFRENADYFLNKANKALVFLEQSYYSQWVQKNSMEIGLCHRDFIPQNLKLTDNGELYVFDLDTLTIDLPALDLRKLINYVCKRRGKWEFELVKSMVGFYNSVNPLTFREWEVVFIDLMYPHLFYSLVNSYCQKCIPGCLNNCNIERLCKAIEFEKSKDNILESLNQIIK